MSRRAQFIIIVCAFLALLPVIAQKGALPKSNAAHPETAQPTLKAAEPDGQRVFRQNCARCHDAPQGFPAQVSGTVLRHMRIRASLSEKDEKALMQFMNP